MKINPYLFLVLSLLVATTYGQNGYIQLVHKKDHHVRIIQEGKRIVVRTINGHTIKGTFKISDHQHVNIKGNRIPLSEIVLLTKKTTSTEIVGHTLIAAAGVTVLSAIGIIVGGSNAEFIAGPLMAGTVLAASGTVVKKTPWYKAENWEIKLVTKLH